MNKKESLQLAKQIAEQSKCLKVKYGAVIVKDGFIVSLGVNNPLPNVKSCKKCSRIDVPHGKYYTSKCPTLHAEEWAIINAIKDGESGNLDGAIVYISGIGVPKGAKPCYRCERLLKGLGIKKIVIGE